MTANWEVPEEARAPRTGHRAGCMFLRELGTVKFRVAERVGAEEVHASVNT